MLSNVGKFAVRRAGLGLPQPSVSRVRFIWHLHRVCRNQNGSEKHAAYSPHTAALDRSYATAAAPASKPRAKKAITTTKSVAKKTRAAKTAKKATKPKARSKKVAAKKAKPRVKKVLSEAQKTKLAAKKARDESKELKAAALLDAPKTLPSTAWQVMFQEAVSGRKAEIGKGGVGLTKIAVDAGTTYKSLDPSAREHYNHVANQNKEKNEIAFKKWVESHTPDQIRLANVARRALKRKDAKGTATHKYPPIEDSRLPKRGRSGRLVFQSERFESGDLKGIALPEATQAITREWDALSASEKKHYDDIGSAEQRRYAQEYKTVFHREMPAITAKKAIAAA